MSTKQQLRQHQLNLEDVETIECEHIIREFDNFTPTQENGKLKRFWDLHDQIVDILTKFGTFNPHPDGRAFQHLRSKYIYYHTKLTRTCHSSYGLPNVMPIPSNQEDFYGKEPEQILRKFCRSVPKRFLPRQEFQPNKIE